jgi:copper chaperone
MPVFLVPDMTCDGCVRAVTNAVQAVDGAAVVKADLTTKRVVIDSSADAPALAEAVRDAGFTVEAA